MAAFYLLQENGNFLLQENGDKIIIDGSVSVKVEKSLKYTVLTTPTANERGLTYTVLTSDSETKSLEYTIIAPVTPIEKTKMLE